MPGIKQPPITTAVDAAHEGGTSFLIVFYEGGAVIATADPAEMRLEVSPNGFTRLQATPVRDQQGAICGTCYRHLDDNGNPDGGYYSVLRLRGQTIHALTG